MAPSRFQRKTLDIGSGGTYTTASLTAAFRKRQSAWSSKLCSKHSELPRGETMKRHASVLQALLMIIFSVSVAPLLGESMVLLEEVSEQLGSHHVSITTDAPIDFHSVSKNVAGTPKYADFVLNHTRVIIRDEQLLVNGKHYGKLEHGDHVRVRFGTVLVQSKKREGTSLPAKAISALFPASGTCEIRETLGEFPVTIKLNTARGVHTKRTGRIMFLNNDVTAKRTELWVRDEDNYLFVNDKGHGFLTKGDKIEVTDGKVFVSGKLRQKGDRGNIPSLEAFGKAIEKLVTANIPQAKVTQEKHVIRFGLRKTGIQKQGASSKGRDLFLVIGFVEIRPGYFPGKSGESVVRHVEEPHHRYLSLNPRSTARKCYLHVSLYSQKELPKEFVESFIKLTRSFESYLGEDQRKHNKPDPGDVK